MDSQTSTPLEAVQALWKEYERRGDSAVIDALDPDARWTQRDGRVIRGRLEIQAFADDMKSRGLELELRPYSFEEAGPWVIVAGGVRTRSRHGLADTQRCWAYRVKEGLLVEIVSFGSREEALRAIAASLVAA